MSKIMIVFILVIVAVLAVVFFLPGVVLVLTMLITGENQGGPNPSETISTVEIPIQ